MIAHYCLHKFHWRPTEVLTLSIEEKAFVAASIQIKVDGEKEQEKKANAKRPRKR